MSVTTVIIALTACQTVTVTPKSLSLDRIPVQSKISDRLKDRLNKQLRRADKSQKLLIKNNPSYRKFQTVGNTILPSIVANEIKNSSIISLSYFDGKALKYSWKSKVIAETTLIPGASMAKSITSYVAQARVSVGDGYASMII